jgi:hypothetical protein
MILSMFLSMEFLCSPDFLNLHTAIVIGKIHGFQPEFQKVHRLCEHAHAWVNCSHCCKNGTHSLLCQV